MLNRGKVTKGEKGFTLIELLVVVGIIVVLAAIIIPLVLQFANSGEQGARAGELDSIQTAIDAMMVGEGAYIIDDGGSISNPIVAHNLDEDHLDWTKTVFIVLNGDNITLEDYLRESHTAYCYIWDSTGRILDQSAKPVEETVTDSGHTVSSTCPS